MKARKTKKKVITRDLIIDEVFELIERRGWVHLTFQDIARHMGISLLELHRYFPDKCEILKAMAARIDAETLKRVASDIETLSPADRLFDVVMSRFEVSKPYKAALYRMWQEGFRHPYLIAVYFPVGFNSMIWVLEAAGVHRSGLIGILQVKAFGLLYLKLLNTWFEDRSEDLTKTMADVDKNIKRFHECFSRLFTHKR